MVGGGAYGLTHAPGTNTGLGPAGAVYYGAPMHERLLILAPDRGMAKRLGNGWVTFANFIGLALGGLVAIILIAALTA